MRRAIYLTLQPTGLFRIREKSDTIPQCHGIFFLVHGGAMLTLTFTQTDIDELNDLRFHHPDPIVMKRCETVYLKAKKLKTGQIRELTGFDVKTIRSHLHLFKNGGIEALKHREPYRPQGELDEHKLSIEQEFRERPPASIKKCRGCCDGLMSARRSRSCWTTRRTNVANWCRRWRRNRASR